MDGPFPPGMVAEIEKFLSTDSERPRGLDLYPEVFDTEFFFPLQRQRELARMIEVAREYDPEVVYEIGSDKGSGLYHWVKCLPTVRRAIASEIRGTPYRDAFERAFPEIDFLWIEGSSYDPTAIKKIKDWLGDDKLNSVFIDGDKNEFERDFDLVLPMMSRPSVAFMHDIRDDVPGRAFNRVASRGIYRYSRIVDIQDSLDAMEREKLGEPCRGSHDGWLRQWKGQSCGVGVIRI